MGPIKATIPLALAIALLGGSCASMRDSAGVNDDIYYSPSDPRPAPTASTSNTPAPKENAQVQEQSRPSDDYYDPKTAQTYNRRSYYDMAYNDPYYYNYGRFGFGSGMGMGMMGWQSGWNGPGWGGGMGWGMGSGWGGSYSYWSVSYGWGNGFYDPFRSPFYDPWYGYYRPYGGFYRPMPYWDPYMGYGYGNYYGPYGACYACYAPVIVGGSSGLVVGHRPTLGGRPASSGSGDGQVSQPRSVNFRDPVGLTPATRHPEDRSISRQGDGRIMIPQQERPSRTWPSRNEGGRDRNIQRNPDPGGRIDMPSRSNDRSPSRNGGGGGGGSSPTYSPRPR